MIARLQLADPISPGSIGQTGVAREPLLVSTLVKIGIAEAAEHRCLAPKRPDQPELCPDHIGDKTELRFLRELERSTGLSLNRCKRLATGEKMGNQSAARNVRKAQVAGFPRRLERGSHQRNARADVAGPRDDVREAQVDTSLEPEQPAVLDQV